VLAKFYDATTADLKHFPVVEIVGVLWYESNGLERCFPYADEGSFEDWNDKTSLARIHVVQHRLLGDWNPALPTAEERALITAVEVAAARTLTLKVLERCTGDALSAEYVLLLLASRIFNRTDAPHGLMPLLLCGGSSELAGRLAAAIRSLMPRVVPVDLSIESLNAHRFKPEKDYDEERLLAGLQLAPGTVLVVDETRLAAGKLGETATRNILTLQSVLDRQLLPVSFGAYDLNYETEAPGLVITAQGRSVLRDVNYVGVPLVGAGLPASPTTPVPEDLTPARRYLAAVRSHVQPLDTLTEEMQKQVESTFLKYRKVEELVTQQSLFVWMTLARSLVASHGESALSPAHWAEVMRLEDARRNRLRRLDPAEVKERHT
jgi:hypothetical protein